MFFYHLIFLIFSIVTFASPVSSVCVNGQVIAQATKYGTVDKYCSFNNIKVLPGSSFKLAAPDCLECKCTTKSMICCGFGFAAGSVTPPAGYVAHNDACKLIFVNKNNSSDVYKPTKSINSIKKKFSKSS